MKFNENPNIGSRLVPSGHTDGRTDGRTDRHDEANSHFMVTPCINNIQHFNFQLMHTTLENVELLKHFKIRKTAPTCFVLQGNHHQGATVST